MVIGGGIAGLTAARALADAFTEVLILDRDARSGPDPRPSVPQGAHPHILLTSGKAVLEQFFPEFGHAILSAGGVEIDWSRDLRYFDEGAFVAGGPRPMPMYLASRPLIEDVIGRLVDSRDPVERRFETQVVRPVEEEGTVTGVEIRRSRDVEFLAADLVVDATGRASRTPTWLSENGYVPPPTEQVTSHVRYSTIRVDRPSDDRRLIYAPPSPPRTRGGGAFPVEDDQWFVTLWGINGDEPPSDPEELTAFAETLPVDTLHTVVEAQTWRGSDVATYPYPSSRWQHYEHLHRFPDRFIVVGDAIASFNPIYGQGMSVATMQALLLHHALASDGQTIHPQSLFDDFTTTVETAWRFTIGGDFRFSGTVGPKPRGTTVFNRYVAAVLRTAHHDGAVADRFARVAMLEAPLWRLFHPWMWWRMMRKRAKTLTQKKIKR